MPSEFKPPLVLIGKSTKVKKLLKHNKLVLPAYNGLCLLCSMHYSSSTDNSIDRKAALGLERDKRVPALVRRLSDGRGRKLLLVDALPLYWLLVLCLGIVKFEIQILHELVNNRSCFSSFQH